MHLCIQVTSKATWKLNTMRPGMKKDQSSLCSFIHSYTNANPSIPCTALPHSLHIYLAIYLNSQFLLHYCLTLHLPSLFISVIIRLYFPPLYSSLSLPPSLSVSLWSLLQTTSIVLKRITWMETAGQERGRKRGEVKKT